MNLNKLFAGAAAALALSFAGTEAAKADPATPQTVGGSVFGTNVWFSGSVSATGLDGVTASSSAIGSANHSNGFGDYSSITATTVTAPMDLLGSVILNSGATGGNVTAFSSTNSAYSSSSVGAYNLTDNVGQVDKFTVNGIGNTITNGGIAQLSSVTLQKGDLVATAVQNSTLADTSFGNGNGVNNYGGYASLQTTFQSAAALSSGNVYVNEGAVNSGNTTATSAVNSNLASDAVGYNNYARSVGQVNQFSYVNTPAPK